MQQIKGIKLLKINIKNKNIFCANCAKCINIAIIAICGAIFALVWLWENVNIILNHTTRGLNRNPIFVV